MCAQYFAKDVSGSLARAGECMIGCEKAEGEDVGKMVTRRDGRDRTVCNISLGQRGLNKNRKSG